MTRPFSLVDVFGTTAFSGNPLAVVAAAEGLSTAEMQAMARWLNLSETAFLLSPTDPAADYRVRIFTLAHELPFAGHPTLGAAHAWIEAGGRPKSDRAIIQECGAGMVPIRRTDGKLAFAAPPLLRSGAPDEADIAHAAETLRIDRTTIVDAAWADNGPGWLAVLLGSAEEVLAIEPARTAKGRVDIGVVGPHAPGGETAFEVRAIFSDGNEALIEDPATGSLNASVGQWLFDTGRATRGYTAAQGTRLGRTARIHVDRDANGQVWVAGKTRTLFLGQAQN